MFRMNNTDSKNYGQPADEKVREENRAEQDIRQMGHVMLGIEYSRRNNLQGRNNRNRHVEIHEKPDIRENSCGIGNNAANQLPGFQISEFNTANETPKMYTMMVMDVTDPKKRSRRRPRRSSLMY